MPYVILDFKREELINGIERAEYILPHEKIPKHPGIYILPITFGQDDELEHWFWKVHRHKNVGLFIDEGYMVPVRRGLRALLTQGRSLHIPMTILTQRPTGCTPFIHSEADFHCLFPLNDQDDIKRALRHCPRDPVVHPAWDMEKRLEKYHARWYDVGEDFSAELKPVPTAEKILARFEQKLKPKRRWI